MSKSEFFPLPLRIRTITAVDRTVDSKGNVLTTVCLVWSVEADSSYEVNHFSLELRHPQCVQQR